MHLLMSAVCCFKCLHDNCVYQVLICYYGYDAIYIYLKKLLIYLKEVNKNYECVFHKYSNSKKC